MDEEDKSKDRNINKRKNANQRVFNKKKLRNQTAAEDNQQESMEGNNLEQVPKDLVIIPRRDIDISDYRRGELMPYFHDWKVILRSERNNQVVLYNQRNHQLALTDPDTSLAQISSEVTKTGGPNRCGWCHQKLPTINPLNFEEENEEPMELNSEPNENINDMSDVNDSSYVDRNYFKWLSLAHKNKPTKHLLPDLNLTTKQLNSNSGTSTPNTNTSRDSTNSIEHNPIDGNYSHLSQASFNQGYYNRFFRELKKLGKGARGNVFLCQHVLDNIKLGIYAVKKISIGHDHSWLVRMVREVHMLEKLTHPNIIDYKHAWIENHKPGAFSPEIPCLFILMECANGGNLEEYIQNRNKSNQDIDLNLMTAKQKALHIRKQNLKKKSDGEAIDDNFLSLKEIWSLFMDACKGLSHLHQYNIVHRDIKPQNLVLKINEVDNSNDIPTLLLSDFGECEDSTRITEVGRTGATGTLEFMAPELLRVDQTGSYLSQHTSQSDMWSLGMVLYYLCYSSLPYQQTELIDPLRNEILSFQGIAIFPDDINQQYRIPSQVKKVISLLLSVQPNRRPSAEEILNNAKEVVLERLVPGPFLDNDRRDERLEESSSRSFENRFTPKVSSPLSKNTKESSPINISTTTPNYKSLTPLDQITPSQISGTSIAAQIGPSVPTILLFGVKLLSTLLPCYPQSTQLSTLIPITSIATIGLYSDTLFTQMVLLFLHILLFLFFYFFNTLCATTNTPPS